jgi:DUF1680 family protein
VGWFSSYANASSWFMDFPRAPGVVACCLGNGSRSLYLVWQSILTQSPGRLRVNLLLNRASPWADVSSHLPYTGQVDVHVKQDTELFVRIPGWVETREVSCRCNGQSSAIKWDGRYVSPGRVAKGDVVTVSFSVRETVVSAKIGEGSASLTMRGSTVVDIHPRGVCYPLCMRAAFRSNETRWKSAYRFVADARLHW